MIFFTHLFKNLVFIPSLSPGCTMTTEADDGLNVSRLILSSLTNDKHNFSSRDSHKNHKHPAFSDSLNA